MSKVVRVWTRYTSQLGAFVDRHIYRVTITALVITLFCAFLAPYSMITIEAGHQGVLWKRFAGGTQLRQAYTEGTHLIFPWDTMAIYDMRLQVVEKDFPTQSSDGLTIIVHVAARYHLISKHLPQLHKFAGEAYREALLIPSVGSAVRYETSNHTPEQIYSSLRAEMKGRIEIRVRQQLRDAMKPEEGPLEDEYLALQDVLLLQISLPQTVQAAIDRKNEQFHLNEEYAFRVDREHKESARKRIEAEGIRDFQQIVATGITDSFLRWKGIEATLSLAQSNNSKVVVIGGGKDGLPLLLGGVDAAPTAIAPGPLATRPTASLTMPPPSGPLIPIVRPTAAGMAKPAPASEPLPVPQAPATPAAAAPAGTLKVEQEPPPAPAVAGR